MQLRQGSDRANSLHVPEPLLLKMRMILAAVDQSRHAHSVMASAAELSSLLRMDLVVLTVLDSDPMKKFSIDEERNKVARFQRELIFKHFPKNQVSIESTDTSGAVYRYSVTGTRIYPKILQGPPVDSICTFADQSKTDLVIVGNRGLGNVGGLVLGSVSERVVHKCTRTVMVVKGEDSENSDWEALLNNPDINRSLRNS